MKPKSKVGRPPVTAKRYRLTVLVSPETDEFIRWIADSRNMNLSAAVNFVVGAVQRNDRSSLDSLSREFNLRRQF